MVSLARYFRDAFVQRQQAVGLSFDLENFYETTCQYGIIRDLHRIGLRGRLSVFVSEYLRNRRIRVRIGTILSDEFYPEEGVPTGGVLALTYFGLKINELPSCIARDIFRALFVDDLAIWFCGRSLDTIERHLQQAVNTIQEWATRNGFGFATQKCKVIHFTAPRSRVQRPPAIRIGNKFLPVEESAKFLGLWWDSRRSFRSTSVCYRHSAVRLWTLSEWSLTWSGGDTLLMLYQATVCSKLDYGCIVYLTASNTNWRQLDSIHNSGLRVALGAFCTSPISNLNMEANETPLEERRLKLCMHYYLKTRGCVDNPAHHALYEFDWTTRDLYACIEGNERVDQLAKETLDQDIDPLAGIHHTDLKPLVNSYIQQLVQNKWDVAVHGRDLYLVKPKLESLQKYQHLTRAKEVVITRLRIGHTKATKSHISSRWLPTACHHCGQTLSIVHMPLKCAVLQECCELTHWILSLRQFPRLA